ncbi:hypothetical protein [Priestia abyssalis]|uniref:hypothetical protein n=1 Tax=Priestia abyssalis TaxID=1221450 RepID=UPI0014759087|nr:hypothetical protein [Priestia abyssalis]
MKKTLIADLNDKQWEKIRTLEEELGVDLVPFTRSDEEIQGDYYELYEDDRL